jgi:hypothetical protein
VDDFAYKNDIYTFYLFIEKYGNSRIRAIKSFAKGIKRGIDAVENAVAYDYSNGFVEGTNNRNGFETLFLRIESISNELNKAKVGLEANGHYSYNLLGFLLDKGLPTYVINPLHTNLAFGLVTQNYFLLVMFSKSF